VVRNVVLIVVEIDVGRVKIQRRKGGSFLVTIPSAAVKILQIKDNEYMTVFIDVDESTVTFKLEK
jgi:antitoxin component of MazEF toxin-antitoxin module